MRVLAVSVLEIKQVDDLVILAVLVHEAGLREEFVIGVYSLSLGSLFRKIEFGIEFNFFHGFRDFVVGFLHKIFVWPMLRIR